MEANLTKEETKAIRQLEKLAKSWPKSLWLFSASGSLCVMKTNKLGQRVYGKNDGVDREYAITSIDIPNDGGDW